MPGLPDEATDLERNIYFCSLMSFDNINMVRNNQDVATYAKLFPRPEDVDSSVQYLPSSVV